MSAGMYGADVEQLRTLARQFDNAADELSRANGTLGAAVNTQQAWLGPDASQFRSVWQGQHSPGIRASIAALQTGADRLRLNAQEQETASAGGDSGTGRSGSASSGYTTGGLDGGMSAAGGSTAAWLAERLRGGTGLASATPISASAMFEAFREAELGGIKPWDLLQSINKVADVPMLDTFLQVGDTVELIDKLVAGDIGWKEGTDFISDALKSRPDPVSKLGGAAIRVWSEVAVEAGKADFSSENLDRVGNYAAQNPGVVVEEVGKAAMQVGSKLITWLL